MFVPSLTTSRDEYSLWFFKVKTCAIADSRSGGGSGGRGRRLGHAEAEQKLDLGGQLQSLGDGVGRDLQQAGSAPLQPREKGRTLNTSTLPIAARISSSSSLLRGFQKTVWQGEETDLRAPAGSVTSCTEAGGAEVMTNWMLSLKLPSPFCVSSGSTPFLDCQRNGHGRPGVMKHTLSQAVM